MAFQETSALDNTGVEAAFKQLLMGKLVYTLWESVLICFVLETYHSQVKSTIAETIGKGAIANGRRVAGKSTPQKRQSSSSVFLSKALPVNVQSNSCCN